jgi:DNA-binding transcriptional LysR family regulator
MFLAAFAAVAGSELIATAPTRLGERFGAAFGLQSFAPPLPIDPIVMGLVRSRIGLGDPAIDWLVTRIAAAFGPDLAG